MIRPILPLAAVLVFPSSPVLAQSFTGPRVELTAGYDRLNANDRFPDLPSRVDGVRLGGAAGYDVAIGSHLILGVEAGAGWTIGAKTTATFVRDRVSENMGRDFDLSVRAGVRLSPRTIAFGKVGYANSRFNVTYDEAVAGGYERERFHATRGGLRLGAGFEQSLGGRTFAQAEYRWTHYSDGTGYVRSPVRHQLLLGVGTRF